MQVHDFISALRRVSRAIIRHPAVVRFRQRPAIARLETKAWPYVIETRRRSNLLKYDCGRAMDRIKYRTRGAIIYANQQLGIGGERGLLGYGENDNEKVNGVRGAGAGKLKSASVAFIITRETREKLFDLGFSTAQIKCLRPADALLLVQKNVRSEDMEAFLEAERKKRQQEEEEERKKAEEKMKTKEKEKNEKEGVVVISSENIEKESENEVDGGEEIEQTTFARSSSVSTTAVVTATDVGKKDPGRQQRRGNRKNNDVLVVVSPSEEVADEEEEQRENENKNDLAVRGVLSDVDKGGTSASTEENMKEEIKR